MGFLSMGLRAAGFLVALAWGVASGQTAPAMELKPVSPSAWYVEGASALGSSANQNFISNAGFVVTPAGVVVIDALGSPALAERLMAQIRRVTPQPVTHVIVTHYHADHIYGLQAFKAAGARIVAHRLAIDLHELRHRAAAAAGVACRDGALGQRRHAPRDRPTSGSTAKRC